MPPYTSLQKQRLTRAMQRIMLSWHLPPFNLLHLLTWSKAYCSNMNARWRNYEEVFIIKREPSKSNPRSLPPNPRNHNSCSPPFLGFMYTHTTWSPHDEIVKSSSLFWRFPVSAETSIGRTLSRIQRSIFDIVSNLPQTRISMSFMRT